MVQNTPLVGGIVSSMIEHYAILFLDKEVETVLGIALYDYLGDSLEDLSFAAGDRIKVLDTFVLSNSLHS